MPGKLVTLQTGAAVDRGCSLCASDKHTGEAVEMTDSRKRSCISSSEGPY